MGNTDIRTLIEFDVSEKGVSDAQKALKTVVREQQALVAQFKSGEKSAEQFNREMSELQKNEKSLIKAIDTATGQFTEQAAAMKAAAKEAERLAKEQEQLSTAQGRFDSVSQQVSLSGDVESGLRTVGGAIGAFGGSGIEQGIGKGAELFAVVEALPRLKEAVGGLPQVINAAGASLGTSGAGFIGILGLSAVAIGAVTLAFDKFQRDAQKQAEELSQVIDARLSVADFVSGGGTTEEAQARLAELEASRQAELSVLKDLQTQYDANITSAGLLGNVMQAVSPQEEELSTRIKQLEASTSGSASEIALLTKAMEDGSLAAGDAKAAEEALAQQRMAQLFTDAAQAGELAEIRARAVEMSKEQIEGELKGLQVRETALKAEIAALSASGDTSTEVAAKLAQLRDELSHLGDESAVLKTARKSARSETAEKAAEEAKAKREQAAKDRQAQAEQAQRERDTARKQREQQAEQARKEAEQAAQRMKDFQAKVLEDQIKQRIDHERKLEDIVTSFGDKRFDALEEQNFLALDKLNTEQARANRDASKEDQRARQDLTRNAQNEQRRLLDEAQRASQQRLQIEATAYRQSVNNVRQWAGGITAITEDMARRINRLNSSTTTVSRSSTGTQPRSR